MIEPDTLAQIARDTNHLTNPNAWRAIHAAVRDTASGTDRGVLAEAVWKIRKQIRKAERLAKS